MCSSSCVHFSYSQRTVECLRQMDLEEIDFDLARTLIRHIVLKEKVVILTYLLTLMLMVANFDNTK